MDFGCQATALIKPPVQVRAESKRALEQSLLQRHDGGSKEWAYANESFRPELSLTRF